MTIASIELRVKTNLLEDLERRIERLIKEPPTKALGPFLRGQYPDAPSSHHKYRACECDNTRINLLLKLLASNGLYPLSRPSQGGSLQALLNSVGKVISEAKVGTTDSWSYMVEGHLDCDRCRSGFIDEIERLRDRAKDAFGGLCLDCVSQGEDTGGADASPCRVVHHGDYAGIDRIWFDSHPEIQW